MSQNQNQPLPRLPLTGEEPEPNLASVDQVISEKVCFSPSLVKGRAGEGLPLTSAGEGLVLPYNKNLTALARENRSNPTKAESKIWQEVLRMRQFAQYKFLRQKPIDNYIVDFYCSELRLVIEIDGDSHAETVEYDAVRTKVLESLGLRVVRFTNNEVLGNIEGIYEELIKTTCANNTLSM
jgi:very-short-patch-repair endonuclease